MSEVVEVKHLVNCYGYLTIVYGFLLASARGLSDIIVEFRGEDFAFSSGFSGGVAHRLEQAAHNHLVDGSIPSTPTRRKSKILL